MGWKVAANTELDSENEYNGGDDSDDGPESEDFDNMDDSDGEPESEDFDNMDDSDGENTQELTSTDDQFMEEENYGDTSDASVATGDEGDLRLADSLGTADNLETDVIENPANDILDVAVNEPMDVLGVAVPSTNELQEQRGFNVYDVTIVRWRAKNAAKKRTMSS
jgi:hypothetical protein